MTKLAMNHIKKLQINKILDSTNRIAIFNSFSFAPRGEYADLLC